jgi:type IV secretion system protein VirD4
VDKRKKVLIACAILFCGSLFAATELTAARFAFQPSLGHPVMSLFGLSLYPPWDLFLWFRFLFVPGAGPILLSGFFVFMVGGVGATGGLWYVVNRSNMADRKSTLHGSAHWATEAEIAKTGLLASSGVYVGAFKGGAALRYLRHDGPDHVLAFAPTRSGKGVGLVLPTLLSWPHSVLVHDIKGENWALSAGWRQKELGSLCLKFDPTVGDGSSVRFNPLSEIRIGTDKEIQDVQNIATMIVDPDGKGLNDHWAKTGFALLVGVILHVLYAEKDKTLRGVARFISNPAAGGDTEFLEIMKSTQHDPKFFRGWVDRTGGKTGVHPVVAESAQEMLNKADNERSGVISTAMSFLSLYRDPVVARNTETSDFMLTDLMNSDKPVSLYIVVPPSDKDRLKPLVRLIVNQTVRRLTESMAFAGGKSVAGYKHRLLLMIDEFPALGKLDIFAEALAFIAGYGLKAYLITQDLSQLYAAYTRDESILSNCNVKIAYAPNKIETAKLLSEMCGKTTMFRATTSLSGGRFSWILKQKTIGEQEFGRELLMPDEAMSLPPDETLVFVAGHSPIRGKKIRYYDDPEFSRRAAIPSPEGSDRVRTETSAEDERGAGEEITLKEDVETRLVETTLSDGASLFPDEGREDDSAETVTSGENGEGADNPRELRDFL